MKKFRGAAALLLALSMLIVPAAGADSAAAESAETLHALGLFQGVIAGRFDEESMALDKPATRIEALVMFVRLLGWEEESAQTFFQNPFADVPSWAAPYAALAADRGIAKGNTAAEFVPDRIITLNEYMTFILRALGYEESAGDFQWNTAADMGLAAGLYDAAFQGRCGDSMTRGDLAQVSLAALSAPRKDDAETLAGYLVRVGVLDQAETEARGVALAAEPKPEIPDQEPAPESLSGEPSTDTAEEAEIAEKYIQRVFELVNEARAEEGLDPLILEEDINCFASIRAVELVSLFDHSRPDGGDCFSVFDGYDKYGYLTAGGENIAFGQSTPEKVMAAWMNSPGHRANILNSSFVRIGIGWYKSHWVQLFATFYDDIF